MSFSKIMVFNLETVLILFCRIQSIRPFHAEPKTKASAKGIQVRGKTISGLLRERLDPWHNNVLFICGKMHGDLQGKERERAKARERESYDRSEKKEGQWRHKS
jgi:hypothetical protein